MFMISISQIENYISSVIIYFDKTEGVSRITDQRWITGRSATITSGPSGLLGTRSWFAWTAAFCRGRSELLHVWNRPVSLMIGVFLFLHEMLQIIKPHRGFLGYSAALIYSGSFLFCSLKQIWNPLLGRGLKAIAFPVSQSDSRFYQHLVGTKILFFLPLTLCLLHQFLVVIFILHIWKIMMFIACNLSSSDIVDLYL